MTAFPFSTWTQAALDLLIRRSDWIETREVLAFDVEHPEPWHGELIELCEERMARSEEDCAELERTLRRLRLSEEIEIPEWDAKFQRWFLRRLIRAEASRMNRDLEP